MKAEKVPYSGEYIDAKECYLLVPGESGGYALTFHPKVPGEGCASLGISYLVGETYQPVNGGNAFLNLTKKTAKQIAAIFDIPWKENS